MMLGTDCLPYAVMAFLSACLGAVFGLWAQHVVRTGSPWGIRGRGRPLEIAGQQRLRFALRQQEPRSFWPPLPPNI